MKVETLEQVILQLQPKNGITSQQITIDQNACDFKIYYTTNDGQVIPQIPLVFGANIVSNTYENGKGIITFDGKITSIGRNAFAHCYSLTSVAMPNSVTSIGDCAFYNCGSLTSITIPDSVTSIGGSAFFQCSSLICISIGNSVTSIGKSAFNYCSSLKSITIPDNVSYIADTAFTNCQCLASFYGKFASTDNRYLIINGVLHSFAPAGLTEYTIPNSVTKIGSYAFYHCSNLTNIFIPDSVTSIGECTFCYCTSLTSITIPESITSIRDGTFENCI